MPSLISDSFPPGGEGAEYLLRNRNVNSRQLVEHLDDAKKRGEFQYRLETQKDFFIIHTPKELTEAQKQAIKDASKPKPTPDRLPISTRGLRKRRSHTPVSRPDPDADTRGSPGPPKRSYTTRTSAGSKFASAVRKLGVMHRISVSWKNVVNKLCS